MVFSFEKWEEGRELQRVIKGSSAMDWIVFGPVLTDAFELFIRPLLGDEMTVKLTESYKEDKNKDLIRLAQRANANLAIWYNFNELNTVLSSSGTQRHDSESFKTLYKYQERNLRDGYKTKGFDALDNILKFLESNISDYPEYKESKTYQDRSRHIVPSAEIINKYLPIDSSRLVFLRFLPHMNFVEETKIISYIGEDLFVALKEDEEKYRELREKLQPVVINLAAARLVRQTGNITDRGLYFSAVMAGISGNDETSYPADPVAVEISAKQFESDAKDFMNIADRYIKKEFSDMHRGTPGGELNVDNDDRKIFWA